MKKLLSFFIFLAAISSGYGQEASTETTQMERVMKVHDDLMAEDMGTMVRLIGQLQTKSKAGGDTQKYDRAVTDLKLANKAMADWMQGFGSRFTADEMMKGKALSGQKQRWLTEEENKLNKLKSQIDSSIASAKAILQ
ncbi:hypothetical protein ABV409_05635 [Flagellimonas sp. DF-77]|uniref:hypothetical protein n=1 Tax=Flagellimonas algarum TaxID=3230298 RepID=UPI00339A5F0A